MKESRLTNQWLYYGITFLASLVYLYLTFSAPYNPSSARLGLGPTQILLLKITIAIPYLASWAFAMYGLYMIEKYIKLAKEKDEVAVSLLRSFFKGIFWIVMGMIAIALVGGLRSQFVAMPEVLPTFTIITNYLYAFPPLIGFYIIYRGAQRLRSSNEMSMHAGGGHALAIFTVLLISAFYVFLIFTNPNRQTSLDPAIPATYYLSDSLILLTLVLPILTTWWLGFSSAFILSDLIPHLNRPELFKGISRILYGIWAIIFTSIIIQALVSLGGTRLYAIGIGALLALIYVFILLQGLGYFFISFGARALQKSTKITTK